MNASTFTRRQAMLAIVLTIAIIVAAGAITQIFDLPAEMLVVLADVPLALLGLYVLRRRGGLRAAGIQPQPWGRAFTLSAPLFLPAVVTLALALRFGGNWAPQRVLVFALLALLVGITEEVLFRGVVYTALRRLGVGRAVVGSAAI
ncbi:MAG: CPBP family glutamic-type intramembrane protease, partial [Deinococcales bacterium]